MLMWRFSENWYWWNWWKVSFITFSNLLSIFDIILLTTTLFICNIISKLRTFIYPENVIGSSEQTLLGMLCSTCSHSTNVFTWKSEYKYWYWENVSLPGISWQMSWYPWPLVPDSSAPVESPHRCAPVEVWWEQGQRHFLLHLRGVLWDHWYSRLWSHSGILQHTPSSG